MVKLGRLLRHMQCRFLTHRGLSSLYLKAIGRASTTTLLALCGFVAVSNAANQGLNTTPALPAHSFPSTTLTATDLSAQTAPRRFNSDTSVTIRVAIYEEHREALDSLFAAEDCRSNTNYNVFNMILVEAMLLCQALHHSGLDFKFEWISVPNQVRTLSMLNNNVVDIAAFTLWYSDLTPNLIASESIVNQGEYFKGIYTSPDNLELLNVSDPRELLNFTATATESIDKRLLQCVGMQPIYNSNYPNMLRQVNGQRVDFMLNNFATHPSFEHHAFGTVLIPIQGIKVEMPDSLHYFINKSSPHSERLQQSINIGIKELDKLGRIYQAYSAITLFDERTKDWEVLRCFN